MKVTVDRSIFSTALSHVQSVVERRTVTPILANVFMEASGEELRLTTTDLDLCVHEKVGAKVATDGVITVNVHTLHDIVRKLPENSEIQLKVTGAQQTLSIDCGTAHFTLPTLPAEEFTALKVAELPHTFKVTTEELRHLINQTRFAISTEEARYYLNGIYLHTVEEEGRSLLRTVATDGHRLALAEITEPQGAAGMPGVIIPRKAVGELSRLLENLIGDVEVALSLTQISFKFQHIQLITRLIDGTFPDYENVIPKNNSKELVTNVEQLIDAVDRVALLSQEKTRGIKLKLEKNRLTLSAVSQEMGSAVEEITVGYQGETLETGFNARYILDVLQQIESENVQILLEDENAPAVVRGVEESGLLFVLMPMRV